MFQLSNNTLTPETYQVQLKDAGAGACVVFEGWVRNCNDGKPVVQLEYEAYDSMAISEGNNILDEALKHFPGMKAVCVHRKGTLSIGDMAVWVGVSAAHREEAFTACRYIIDEVKHRVPIWKKEYYVDGNSAWVTCQHGSSSSLSVEFDQEVHSHRQYTNENRPPEKETLYARQMSLPEVGEKGQKILESARILIVGAGGLGCPAAQYLASAGIGTIGICEDDTVDATNLHRQPIYTCNDLGKSKAHRIAAYIHKRSPYVNVLTHETRINATNAKKILSEYDLCLDCTDNFETKFLLNDAALAAEVHLIQASIYQYEGQIITVRGDTSGPCLRCLWAEIPNHNKIGSCAEVGVLGAVPGVFGALQAMEALKLLLNLPGTLENEILLFDLLSFQSMKVPFTRRKDCICQIPGKEKWEKIHANTPLELSYRQIKDMPASRCQLIDLRNEIEHKQYEFPLENVISIPLDKFDPRHLQIDSDRTYVFCCNHGLCSKSIVNWFRADGHTNVYSLQGGIHTLRRNLHNVRQLNHA